MVQPSPAAVMYSSYYVPPHVPGCCTAHPAHSKAECCARLVPVTERMWQLPYSNRYSIEYLVLERESELAVVESVCCVTLRKAILSGSMLRYIC